MRKHRRNEAGPMGIMIVAITGLFFALHLALPEVTLWPAYLVCLGIGSMIAAHVGKARKSEHAVVTSSNRHG